MIIRKLNWEKLIKHGSGFGKVINSWNLYSLKRAFAVEMDFVLL